MKISKFLQIFFNKFLHFLTVSTTVPAQLHRHLPLLLKIFNIFCIKGKSLLKSLLSGLKIYSKFHTKKKICAWTVVIMPKRLLTFIKKRITFNPEDLQAFRHLSAFPLLTGNFTKNYYYKFTFITEDIVNNSLYS